MRLFRLVTEETTSEILFGEKDCPSMHQPPITFKDSKAFRKVKRIYGEPPHLSKGLKEIYPLVVGVSAITSEAKELHPIHSKPLKTTKSVFKDGDRGSKSAQKVAHGDRLSQLRADLRFALENLRSRRGDEWEDHLERIRRFKESDSLQRERVQREKLREEHREKLRIFELLSV
ncbi:OLC1v1015355C1 [Oldenlandia corymbosa var. corymbosa]|uniref:OLC1v1015355C1 n=1 Tax=Oldenlandia corymbosa var. corymbosa TaxID=529605 RepID=A0AAV1E6H0_OLDCO|nr:OLC1v1015355C1 [Oldenlandia corymbosa var. corymbosa]